MNASDPKEEDKVEKLADLLNEEEVVGEMPPMGCGILGRYPIISLLVFAAVGIGMGVGLSNWEPDDPEAKQVTLQWLGLIGDMFIRALKAAVLPMVFINVVIAVVEMMTMGRASSIGWLTIGLYLLTTIMASVWGVISIVSFKSLFNEEYFEPDPPAELVLGCNADNFFVTELDDGVLQCMEGDPDDESARFIISEITGSFVRSGGGPKNDISLSDTIYNGVFRKLIPSNIFVAFVDANFAAVVIFAIAFGFALGRVIFRRNGIDTSTSALVRLFKELDGVFLTLINWIIMLTPFAVWSLIVRAVGRQSNLKNAFENVGYLVVATIVAMALHYLISQLGLFTIIRRENPFGYMRKIVPAQAMAFACASSAATIPMTLRSVKTTGVVPDAIGRFVIPLGATINMDGSAIYFPCACIWLAVLNGITPDAASYFLLVIIATIGSAGTAPVPSASLVLIITAYNTVFDSEGTPDGFEFIFAIDWFMDRLRTTLNVTGDCTVCALVSKISKLKDESDVDDDEEDLKHVDSSDDVGEVVDDTKAAAEDEVSS